MLAPLLALAMVLPAQAGKGSGLYNDCKTYIAVTEGGEQRESPEWLQAGRCLGYVKGVAEGLGALHKACIVGAGMDSVIRVYVMFMDQNPKLMDEIEPVGLVYALNSAYPCSVA